MASLTDLMQPYVVNGVTSILAQDPIYCTGGQIVLTDDQVSAVALTISPLPSGAGNLVILDLKETQGFAIRNLTFDSTGDAVSQLPMSTTQAGRLLVNAPELDMADSDPRIGGVQMRVFGTFQSDNIVASSLTVDSIQSLNFRFVQSIYVNANNQIVVTADDGTSTILDVTWDVVTNKPDLEDVTTYLQERLGVAQLNIDSLLSQVATLNSEVAALKLVASGASTVATNPIDQPTIRLNLGNDMARIVGNVTATIGYVV